MGDDNELVIRERVQSRYFGLKKERERGFAPKKECRILKKSCLKLKCQQNLH